VTISTIHVNCAQYHFIPLTPTEYFPTKQSWWSTSLTWQICVSKYSGLLYAIFCFRSCCIYWLLQEDWLFKNWCHCHSTKWRAPLNYDNIVSQMHLFLPFAFFLLHSSEGSFRYDSLLRYLHQNILVVGITVKKDTITVWLSTQSNIFRTIFKRKSKPSPSKLVGIWPHYRFKLKQCQFVL
jgi:hypothetical protein